MRHRARVLTLIAALVLASACKLSIESTVAALPLDRASRPVTDAEVLVLSVWFSEAGSGGTQQLFLGEPDFVLDADLGAYHDRLPRSRSKTRYGFSGADVIEGTHLFGLRLVYPDGRLVRLDYDANVGRWEESYEAALGVGWKHDLLAALTSHAPIDYGAMVPRADCFWSVSSSHYENRRHLCEQYRSGEERPETQWQQAFAGNCSNLEIETRMSEEGSKRARAFVDTARVAAAASADEWRPR